MRDLVAPATAGEEKGPLPQTNDSGQTAQYEPHSPNVLYHEEAASSTPSAPQPAFYAILPATVRYCRELPSTAKLLYGEISSLCGVAGFCWAGNAYFAKLYKISERSVNRLLRSLAEAGFIKINCDQVKPGTPTVRRIYLREAAPQEEPCAGQKCPDETKTSPQQDKNVLPYYIPINNKNNNNKGENDPKTKNHWSAGAQFAQWVQRNGEHWLEDDVQKLLLAFEQFQAMRLKKASPIRTKRMVTNLCNRLEDFSGGIPSVMTAMLHRSTERQWLTVYELPNAFQPHTAAQEGREVAEEWL